MKPITYFCETPIIQKISSRYGAGWELMELADRLCIVRGLADCLFSVEALGSDCSLKLSCIEDGYEFGSEEPDSTHGLFSESAEHLAMVEMLDQLDAELDPQKAANLIEALLQPELRS